jgi:hypothetical protein
VRYDRQSLNSSLNQREDAHSCDLVPPADQIIASWIAEMKARWPGRVFRIYRDLKSDEVIIRFHMARRGLPNWCDEGIEIIVVGTE